MKRVMVVEDSATARRHVAAVLAGSDDFEVVAQARSGEEAIRAAAALEPDIITLDVFLPDLGADEVVRRVLDARAVPILLLSDAPRNAADVFRALEAGAVDFLPKPKLDEPSRASTVLTMLRHLTQKAPSAASVKAPSRAVVSAHRPPAAVVAIASSTGGPAALKVLLASLPRGFSLPILIAQHLTPGFEDGMARWLGDGLSVPVRVVKRQMALAAGVYIGEPDHDLIVTGPDEVDSVPAPSRGYHPSADLLFESAAEAYGGAVISIVMSGIGSDGLRGAGLVHKAGGVVLAQAKASVRGMPESVIRAGLTTFDGTPEQLSARLAGLVRVRA